MLKSIKEHSKLVLLLALIMFVGLSFTACDNGELGDTDPDTYNAEVIIEGIANEDHSEFFSVLADGEEGIDQFNYENNTLTGDITGLSGTTELTLVIDDNLEDGEYIVENEVVDVDQDNNEAKFEVEFAEKVPKIADIDTNNDVEDISVEYGTTEADAIAELVDEIVIIDTEGSEYTVSLDWSIENYDSETDEDYTATGIFDLPEDFNQTDPATDLEVEAIVTVNEEDTYSVTVSYDNGNVKGYGNYAEGEEVELTAIPDEGYKFVEWTGYRESTDNPLTFDMPEEDIEFTANFNPTIDGIDINDDVENISVEYGTAEDDSINKLVDKITITDTEGSEYIVSLDWIIENYDTETADDYTATGVFELPEGVEQTDPATDLEVEAIVAVEEKQEVYFEVEIDQDNSDMDIGLGKELITVVELKNTGNISDEQNVKMILQGEIVVNKKIEISAGENITKEFTHEVSDEAELGYSYVFIEGEDESDEYEIYITEFTRGKGTTENPYLIETAKHLDKVRDYLGSHFKQVSDIDLSGYDNWDPIGDENNPFIGSYNGNKYEISNLTIDREFEDYVGLFGYTNTTQIKNIKLLDTEIYGYNHVGGLVGYKSAGELVDIIIKGSVNGKENTGGLVGYNSGDIMRSYVETDLIGENRTGGLVGNNYRGKIKESYATGNVNGDSGTGGLIGINWGKVIESYAIVNVNGKGIYTGGLVGYNLNDITKSYAKGKIDGEGIFTGGLVGNNNGNIIKSYAKGDVNGESTYTGGLAGINGGNIIKSYAKGSVKGNNLITGGLIGANNGEIENCYSIGEVNGTNQVGGLVGENKDRILSSYSAVEVTGNNNIGGFVGENEGAIGYSYYDKDIAGIDEENAISKSTEEMIQQDIFEPEWNFDNIWSINEGSSYPYLQWQDDNIPIPPE